MSKAKKEREFIVFKLGIQNYCIDIMSVREIRGWSSITPIPHAPSYMLGVINLRGTILPIMDLRLRFGFSHAEPSERNAIVVVEGDGQTVGLLVETVSDIMNVGEDMIQSTPEVSSSSTHEFISGVVAGENGMVSVVSIERTLPQLKAAAA